MVVVGIGVPTVELAVCFVEPGALETAHVRR